MEKGFASEYQPPARLRKKHGCNRMDKVLSGSSCRPRRVWRPPDRARWAGTAPRRFPNTYIPRSPSLLVPKFSIVLPHSRKAWAAVGSSSSHLVTARSDLDPHLQLRLPSCDGRFQFRRCRLPVATSPTAIAIFDATSFLIFAGTPFSVIFHFPTLSRLPSLYPGRQASLRVAVLALLHSSWPPAAGNRRGDDDGVGAVDP